MSRSHEEEPEPELSEALDMNTIPAADPAFRASLRRRFVAGELESSFEPSVALHEALDAWTTSPAAEEFRARLREQFVHGDISSETSGSEPREAVAQTADSPRPEALRPPWRGRLLTFAAGMAAATLLWVLLSPRESGPRGWRVLDGTLGSGQVVVDGTPVSLQRSAALLEAFSRGGCRLDVREGDLRVLEEGSFLVTLPEGTEAQVVGRSAYGPSELLVLDVDSGGVHVSTADGSEGWIVVRTFDLEVELRGRAIAVDVLEGVGTCVCTLDGLARVRPREAADAPFLDVPSGKSLLQRRDGTRAALAPIRPEHEESLLELTRRRARWL